MKNSDYIWMSILILSWAAIPLILNWNDIQISAIALNLSQSMNIYAKENVTFEDIWFPTIESLGDSLKSIPARINVSEMKGFEQKIPRKIYQTWFNSTFTGPLMKEAVHSWIHLNPEYDYYFFNDQDCKDWILKHCGRRFLTAYLSINEIYGAARSYYFRYLLLWKWGGIYVDIDTILLHPFRDWIHSKDEFITGSGDNVPNQFILIAKPNHTIFRLVALALTERIEAQQPFGHKFTEETGHSILKDIYWKVITQRVFKPGESLEEVIIRKIPQMSADMNVGGHVRAKIDRAGIEKEEQRFKDHWRDIDRTKHSFYVDPNHT